MTNKEIINEIKCLLSELDNGEDAVSYLTQNDVKWLNENIKVLEQKPILDKVRAEIEQNAYPIVHGVNNHEKGMTLYGILQIIDKYKAESEDEE
jgi:hypothetical protein